MYDTQLYIQDENGIFIPVVITSLAPVEIWADSDGNEYTADEFLQISAEQPDGSFLAVVPDEDLGDGPEDEDEEGGNDADGQLPPDED